MTRFLLWLCLLPSGLWRALGADVAQLRAILHVKLTMDDRRPLAVGKSQKKSAKNSTVRAAFFALLTGAFYLFPLFAVADWLTGIFFYYSAFAVLLTFTLLTDFSQVLLDTRDRYILLPRPVGDRTLLLARLLHVFAYLLRTVLPMALPGWIALGIVDGVAGALWFPVPLLLLTLLVLFFINALYVLLLRFTPPERFKGVLSYFQIAFSVLVFASYYLLPRLVDASVLRRFDPSRHPGMRWAPTYWLAGTWSWVGVPAALADTGLLGLLAVVLPLLLVWLLVRVLAPEFARRLGGLDAAERSERTGTKRARRQRARSKGWAGLLTRTPEARAGFQLAWSQSARSRTFRMRVLPTFAYVPVYFVYLLSNHGTDLATTWAELATTRRHLLLLYMTSFVLLQALSYLTLSDQFKAAWVFQAAPVQRPGRVMSGAFLAVWVKFFLPFFAAVSVFVISRWGVGALVDVVLALANVTLLGVLSARLNFRKLPFSQPEQLANSGGKTFLRLLVGLLIPAALGAAHYFAGAFWWLQALFFVLSAIFLWLVWDSYAGTTWSQIERTGEAD